MPQRIASPALSLMLFVVASVTQSHQVIMIERDRWVIHIVQRDMDLVMHLRRWFDKSLLQAHLAQPATVSKKTGPTFCPRS